jgi:hypothetical protein
MTPYSTRAQARKHPVTNRVQYFPTVGFPARSRRRRPFVVRIFRLRRRYVLGGVR